MDKPTLFYEKMNMDKFVEKCIQDHKSPMVKISLPVKKLFFGAKTEEEMKTVDEKLDHMTKALSHLRIERRHARSHGVWIPENNVCKVKRTMKNLTKLFGYQNKDGIFLYPEEMLFLMESNKLEVLLNNTTLSIARGYDIVLKLPDFTLCKYRIFKKLASLGYKLVRPDQVNRRLTKQRNSEKRQLEEVESPNYKKSRIDESGLIEECSQSEPNKYIKKIFGKIRSIMPQDDSSDYERLIADYSVNYPTNHSKPNTDFNVFVCENDVLNLKSFKQSGIYATCVDDVAFYEFGEVHVPYLG